MGNARQPKLPNDLDGLRIFGLGRIPRCTDCLRYRALVDAYKGASTLSILPPGVPEDCTFQVFAPLVARYSRSRPAVRVEIRSAAETPRAVSGL
jgi:hypothetical protein